MALLDIWKSAPATLEKLSIEQIVATAGAGTLSDDTECSAELRTYLSSVTLDALARYAERCLEASFPNSGRVLQDIINEVGRRLDYNVINGRYAGVRGKVGFDGIWNSPEGHTLIVEVKTSDAYRMPLKVVADYRKALLRDGQILEPSSILVVVGREDTGELEAQVRGSRWAWDIRLISVDALMLLAKLKQESDAPETVKKIRTLLVPFDYTRLDEIIDVMFSAAKDVSSGSELGSDGAQPNLDDDTVARSHIVDAQAIAAKRSELIAAVARKFDKALIKKSRATLWDASHTFRVVCSISKPYLRQSSQRYWYAYHPSWDEFLAGGSQGYMVWGCLDLDIAFAISRAELKPLLARMLTTERENGATYWHIKIGETADGQFVLKLADGEDIPLSKSVIDLKPVTASR